MKKITLAEVARLAGVGEATVDRVLNERGNVAPATAERVIRVARELGMKRVLPDEWHRLRHVEVFLSDSDTYFFKQLSLSFMQAADSLGKRRLVLHRTLVNEADPARLAKKLTQAAARRDGIILFGSDHPEVVAAVNAAMARGVPVITLVTELPGTRPLCHVGIDQYAAGRTAGWLLDQWCHQPGEVLLVCGPQEVLVHRERVRGCRERLAESGFRLAPLVLEGREQNGLIESLVRERLNQGRVVAVYNTGPGNAIIARLLERQGLGGRCVLIGHERHATTETLLRRGLMHLALDQNPRLHAFRALELLLGYLEQGSAPGAGERIDFSLITRENLGS
ncbi:LacI family DNA-binding transcriptional regulator [Zobellella aerophila]|uniref:LacI family DNA-binding transcriptional regulator n=1 Tax=Zobellella aerophila TaxID=870480 RepID=A0ABP6VD97_9GAMM